MGSNPSRRGRRSYQTTTKPPRSVGAVAWPRSRMHGPRPLPGGAAGPTEPQPNHPARWERSPDREAGCTGHDPLPGGAAGPTELQPNHPTRWERSTDREARCSGHNPFPAGPPVLPNHNQTTSPGGSGRLTAKQDARSIGQSIKPAPSCGFHSSSSPQATGRVRWAGTPSREPVESGRSVSWGTPWM